MSDAMPYPARDELARQGVTITSVARYIGVRRSYLRAVLNGTETPSFQVALLVAIILQKPVTTMFPGVERPVVDR